METPAQILCSAEHSPGGYPAARRDRGLAALALVAVALLPVAGAGWAGRPAALWTQFPPRGSFIRHAGFHWGAFAFLAVVIAAAVLPVAVRVARHAWCLPAALAPRATSRFPRWGWAALAWTVAWWVAAWTRLPGLAAIQRHTYTPLWVGFIVLLQALVERRTGTCLLRAAPRRLAAQAAVSALFWWGFEWLNRTVENWRYEQVQDLSATAYLLLATPAFATVLPAVLGMHDWLATYPRVTAGLADWVAIRPARPRRLGLLGAVLGGVGLLVLPAVPNALYPLLWLAPVALLCGLQGAAGQATLFDGLGRGDWRLPVRLALAALVCGFFWELWNEYSLARWIYQVPGVGRFRLFEMPVLGFAGYLPFGWECAAVAVAFGLWQPSRHPEENLNERCC